MYRTTHPKVVTAEPEDGEEGRLRRRRAAGHRMAQCASSRPGPRRAGWNGGRPRNG